jgi:hypothetical protein
MTYLSGQDTGRNTYAPKSRVNVLICRLLAPYVRYCGARKCRRSGQQRTCRGKPKSDVPDPTRKPNMHRSSLDQLHRDSARGSICLCSDQSKTSELIILRYNGAEVGRAKHNIEGQQKADQSKCYDCLQIGICDRNKNPLPRFFRRTEIFAFSLCRRHPKRILRLDRLRLRGPSRAQFEFTLAAIAQNLRRLAKLVVRPPPLTWVTRLA